LSEPFPQTQKLVQNIIKILWPKFVPFETCSYGFCDVLGN